MEFNPTRVNELLVGLPDVIVLGAESTLERLTVLIESRVDVAVVCGRCAGPASVKDRRVVELVDLPSFGRPTRLRWRKHRFACRQRCGAPSWTRGDDRIAHRRQVMTARAGRWATWQVGGAGRTVAEVARELGADWHTVNDTVIAFGRALVDDPDRFRQVAALGVDDVLFVRAGEHRTQHWATHLVDVSAGQILDVVEGRDTAQAGAWLAGRAPSWRATVTHATLDLSEAYRAMLERELPDAVQVVDPFHVVRVAGQALDECRRRVQNETLGHRGRRDDPLYRVRRRLQLASERLTDQGRERLVGLLKAGDPRGEVADAWHAKEIVRGIYGIEEPELAAQWVDEAIRDFTDTDSPLEVQRLGRTLKRWRAQVLAWHEARVSNGPTEAMNNLAKRIKRIAFGFRRFDHYRISVLLYAGRPRWHLLPTINPAEIR